MSEVKHTPGPWEVDEHAGRLEIVGRPNWKCRRFGVEGEWRVAVVDDLSEDQDGAEFETEANARLIAAAPDMLEASIAAFYHIVGLEVARSVENNGWEWTDDSPDMVSMVAEYLRAAISKAKG